VHPKAPACPKLFQRTQKVIPADLVAMGFKIREVFDIEEAVKLAKASGGCVQLYCILYISL